MTRIREEIKKIIRGALPYNFDGEVLVSVPDVTEHGDYSTNVAFALAKIQKTSPREAAEEMVAKIKEQGLRMKENVFSRIEGAGGGFINFWISDEALFGKLGEMLWKPEGWGRSNTGKGKKIRVEYFQPNVAKIPHVGHMRSAVIGDALKRIFLSQGHKVVSDTHIGDWGTQFGILLYAWKEASKEDQEKIKKNPVRGLNDLYVAEGKKIEAEPERRERGKEEFAKLEQGDKENRKIWKWMVTVSLVEFDEIKRRFGLLRFEEERAESVYEDAMPPLVERALKKGVAARKPLDSAQGVTGAVVVDLSDVGLGEAVLLKSDGASTYLLRDLATLEYWDKKKLDKNLYVVDIRQSHHFSQVFDVGKRLGIPLASRSEHIVFGFMSLPEGAMSTRKGNVIGLLDVLDTMEARAREIIEKKNPELKNKEKVAKAVGVGALKYFDLSHHPKSNIMFDKEKALSFEGNTGPYLQYTYARLRSILRKIQDTRHKKQTSPKFDECERGLLVEMLRFPEAVEDAAKVYAPSVLANYLYGLAQKANEFYHSHPVLKEGDAEKRRFRLMLVEAVAATLKNGLYLLGIEAVEEM
ncbi:MAG: arginine--tRNA ligase [Patescibacteria group bacterium]